MAERSINGTEAKAQPTPMSPGEALALLMAKLERAAAWEGQRERNSARGIIDVTSRESAERLRAEAAAIFVALVQASLMQLSAGEAAPQEGGGG